MPVHNIEPVFSEKSNILILGSFPSVKSRETGFYYGHPQNRFWKVTAAVFGEKVPETVEEKKKMLLRNGVALWDAAASCEINKSADNTMKNIVPNNLKIILNSADIRKIFLNGKTACAIYEKFQKSGIDIEYYCLPSTSPANASFSLDKLIEAWKIITDC